MGGPLAAWPWDYLGSYKYLLYGPVFAKVLHTRMYEGGFRDEWGLHVVILCTIRVLLHFFWGCFSNMLFIVRDLRIKRNGYDFKQIDTEWNWDNMIILQALIAGITCCSFPEFIENVPFLNLKGFVIALILHIGISEPLYYWLHRFFHTNNYLYTHYHSLRHSSPVLHPFTGVNATFLEQLLITSIISVPLIGCSMMGFASKSLVYGYIIAFDSLRCYGHCNVEFIPYRLFQVLPFLKYLIYTPTYQTVHHEEKDTNFCLFMPVYDVIWSSLNTKSWELHRKNCKRAGKDERVADFVFLAHVVDVTCSMHAPFVNRAFASLPYTARFFLIPFWPVAFVCMVFEWIFSNCFTVSSYNLKGKLHETWAVPRYGFQYFLPFAKDGINKQIENAILKADRLGVKVISLAALNKNESLNGGGTLFVEKHPELRVRVVHGNTLTAAVILNEIPKDVKEVFLTGATSKLGRAIALYLCRKKVRVLMLTLSTERFQKIQKEAPLDCQNYLVHVTKYQAAQNCKTWIVGKWITPREQGWAPPGTHFHQFVVPPILSFRRNCTYGDLAAMRLPDDVQGLGSCEYTMERGVVHACHAGGVVHNLEGWTHHEVGAIDVDKIDLVWNAAMKYGFKPVA